jgi:hypothetical protein
MFGETISLSLFFEGKERKEKNQHFFLVKKQHFFPLFEHLIIFSEVCKILETKTRAISNHMCRLMMANFMLGQIL